MTLQSDTNKIIFNKAPTDLIKILKYSQNILFFLIMEQGLMLYQ